MYVLIAGGGRTGATLALTLAAEKHEVRLVEDRPQVLAHINRELPTELVYERNATDPRTLELAGLGRAQVLVDRCQVGRAEAADGGLARQPGQQIVVACAGQVAAGGQHLLLGIQHVLMSWTDFLKLTKEDVDNELSPSAKLAIDSMLKFESKKQDQERNEKAWEMLKIIITMDNDGLDTKEKQIRYAFQYADKFLKKAGTK